MPSDSNRTAPKPEVDFGKAAGDYGQWRQGFPAEFFKRLDVLGVGQKGQKLLDIGTGTGLLARAFAKRGCQVTGLDLSPELLVEARNADKSGRFSIDYVLGSAEATGQPDASFDVVSAGTCWHWFDRPAAAAEVRRVLRPNGRLLIASLDWHFRPGNVADLTIKTIRRFAPPRPVKTPSSFQYPGWTEDLTGAGFDNWEAFAFTLPLEYSHEAWRGRVRASASVGPVMDPETLKHFETELTETLKANFAKDLLSVDHRVFGLVVWTGPAAT